MLDGDNYSRAEMPIPWYSARIKLCLTESLAGRGYQMQCPKCRRKSSM